MCLIYSLCNTVCMCSHHSHKMTTFTYEKTSKKNDPIINTLIFIPTKGFTHPDSVILERLTKHLHKHVLMTPAFEWLLFLYNNSIHEY